MKNDALGDRMKRYEASSDQKLTPGVPVIIRVDGRSFHNWTRQNPIEKPFDTGLMRGMMQAMVETAREMQGFKLAYAQSDECTFLITDTDSLQSEAWFGNEVNKLVSITASLFTAHFNAYFHGIHSPATFDARAFNVPAEDVPNVFVWRQKDAVRNSLQSYARKFFTHKEMHKKNTSDIHNMLHLIGQKWEDVPNPFKNGVWMYRDKSFGDTMKSYDDIYFYLESLSKKD